ncbi:hypothetical protein [Ancylobacter amanitiformis]|uniref:Lipoprotein n=1 Tax=Ancylobacter amanitiformis TaxID=217069 RepID=A0ABU0LWC8_9HYPH|nr:hypothetical protein [Ancylobacter amanitiformis]MDQ0513021.1 hypothetical protein [Ancylobacter amanitiformis]
MLKLWVKADQEMTRAPAAPLLAAVALGLALAGCAPPGWPETPPSTAPGAAAPPAQGTKSTSPFAPKGPDFLHYGTPKQIGDRPVMTPEQTAKMQSDLENTAKKREQQLKQATDQEGQAGQ